MHIKSNLAIVLLLLCPPLSFAENTSQPNDSHLDELKINSSLQLHDVLEKTIVRNPMQATLQSR
ncbi:MAG: hypothetical protein WBC07_04880, partial [Methylotenera sp.]